ncbi:MAG: hypothetical protein O3A95_05425 [Planctomycetota bacterium]|nr:hypothetical protein [Planctomycetota bacterium]MDA1113726.1 hypothetical protein [Planctomycetota bacterium]
MKPKDQILNSKERQVLHAPTAPEGLWQRIEEAAILRFQFTVSQDESGAPILGGVSRFQSRLRFAAAGMLGFLVFFGLEQAVTRTAGGTVKTSLAAGGLHLVDHLRQEVPLVHDPAAYVDGLQNSTPWPEVTLATYISNNEAN